MTPPVWLLVCSIYQQARLAASANAVDNNDYKRRLAVKLREGLQRAGVEVMRA